MGICAWLFYDYNVLVMGLWLLPFVLNLVITGWIIGVLTTSLIMRFGQEAEILAWSLVFLFQPISCVFYPMEVLPMWLQAVAWINPAAHVFEGMRAVLFEHVFRTDYFLSAIALDLVYLAVGATIFFIAFRNARHRGALLQMGE